MSQVLRDVDARSRLAGANKLEILLFSAGGEAGGSREVFGINVFKVREVMRAPAITRAPEMAPAVAGMVSLRGELVPVIHLARYLNLAAQEPPRFMIVTEYNGRTQGFLVEAVDIILRLDWSRMRVPPDMLAGGRGGLVTAVTELASGVLVMMLDVEKILAETVDSDDESLYRGIDAGVPSGRTVFFADDSSVARRQITRTLDGMKVNHLSAVNGKQAWNELVKIADNAEASGMRVTDHIQLVLTDVEMPEMDGYMLTRCIKSDTRFQGIPVLMHSSLSGASNQQFGYSVGVDEYVPKFQPDKLAKALVRLLA
jgi:two-component system chemotaxis response regulator CheV